MSNTSVTDKTSKKTPEVLKSLILQKLRQTRNELDMRIIELNQAAYSRLHKEMLEGIHSQKVHHIFTQIPLGIYNEIAANAMAITRVWPETVWQTITSILDKAKYVSYDSKELNAIIDEFAWSSDKHPFTLNFVDSARFRASVIREANGYGLFHEETESSYRQWEMASVVARAGIINSAKHSRDGVCIAIDEYLLGRVYNSPPSTQGLKSNTARQEARKLNTQDMYKSWQKEYLKLKKNKPGRSDTWYSEQIAKMACSQGRSAETIRKNMQAK